MKAFIGIVVLGVITGFILLVVEYHSPFFANSKSNDKVDKTNLAGGPTAPSSVGSTTPAPPLPASGEIKSIPTGGLPAPLPGNPTTTPPPLLVPGAPTSTATPAAVESPPPPGAKSIRLDVSGRAGLEVNIVLSADGKQSSSTRRLPATVFVTARDLSFAIDSQGSVGRLEVGIYIDVDRKGGSANDDDLKANALIGEIRNGMLISVGSR